MNIIRKFVRDNLENLIALIVSFFLAIISILITKYLPGLILRKPGMIILGTVPCQVYTLNNKN